MGTIKGKTSKPRKEKTDTTISLMSKYKAHPDIQKIIELENEIKEEKIKTLIDLKEKSLDSDVPITEDEGEVIEKKAFYKKPLFSKPVVSDAVEMKKRQSLNFKDRWILDKSPTAAFMVEMFFSNGTTRTWIIKTKTETFAYKGKCYYLRYEDAWFNITRNQFKMYYHEDYAVPIDRKVVLKQWEDAPEKLVDKFPNIKKCYFTVTPSNIKNLLSYEYISKLAGSETINKLLKMVALIVGVVLFINLLRLFGIVR